MLLGNLGSNSDETKEEQPSGGSAESTAAPEAPQTSGEGLVEAKPENDSGDGSQPGIIKKNTNFI